MKDISLKDLLEAGCHFGHKKERWHPKAAAYIYQAREGVHIIDLVKTKDKLQQAAEFIKSLSEAGKVILFVGTKRQARGAIVEAVKKTDIAYLTVRWIGGFLTNWDEVKKNIDKLNRFNKEKIEGEWSKFPKHEIVKLDKERRKLEAVYNGVVHLTTPPDAIFIIDIRKEDGAVKEAIRAGIKTVAVVDTNVDPTPIDYPIPSNDDAIGAIKYIVDYLVEAYMEGKKLQEKRQEKERSSQERLKGVQENSQLNQEVKKEKDKEVRILSNKEEIKGEVLKTPVSAKASAEEQKSKEEKKEKVAKKRSHPKKSSAKTA